MVDTRTSFNGDEVVLLQLFARQWVSTVLCDVFLYETTLVNVSRLRRHDRVLRRLARDSAEKHFEFSVEVEVKGLLRQPA